MNMRNEINKSNTRNITKRDIIIACVVVAYFLSAMAIAEVYSRTIAAIMIATGVLAGILELIVLPKNEKKAIVEAIEEHDKTRIGRFLKIFHYVIYIAVGVGIIMWVANKMK